MTKSILFGLFISGIAAMSLTACENTKKQFDFSKKAPDEFAVVKRAPLEMPPNFNTIATPQPGARRPQEPTATDVARGALLGEDVTRKVATENNISEGEALLLQKSNATNIPANIRQTVDAETAEIMAEESPGIDKLKKMVGQTVEPPAKVVDPVAETNRIRANKAAGKPVTTGKTPVKE